MRIACVSIPRFACAVEVQRNPRLAETPLIVGDAEQPRRVFDCLPATGRFVQPGMTIRAALAECPEAVIVPPDPVLYRDLWENVLDALKYVSPEIEDDGWGQAYINVSGLQRHYRGDHDLAGEIRNVIWDAARLTPSIGIAGAMFPSFAAATLASSGEECVVEPGNEAAFLSRLDISLLPIDSDVIFRLRLLGFETIGEVAALSLPELQSQFGLEGRRLWSLAQGADDRRLKPRPHRQDLRATWQFETAVAGIDVLVAAARQLLARLRSQLEGRATRELTIRAELATGRGWEHHLVFREPVSENDRLVFLLRSALENTPPPMAVQSLTLRLGQLTGEQGNQLSLDGRARLERQVEDAIRQLKARYGYSPVYRCVDVEPWSAIPEERQILVESDA